VHVQLVSAGDLYYTDNKGWSSTSGKLAYHFWSVLAFWIFKHHD